MTEILTPPEIEPNTQISKKAQLKAHANHHMAKFRGFYMGHKKWTIPLTFLVLIGCLIAVPYTRYKIAGTVLKQNYTVFVADDATQKPITGALVEIGDNKATTDNIGRAVIKSRVGSKRLSVTKKYYTGVSSTVIVPIMKQKVPKNILIHATGRQVPISVINKITGLPVENITISTSGTTAKTDKNGKTVIVLPADKKTLEAKLSGSGYNDTAVNLAVTDQVVKENAYSITPAGRIYFLSKQSGKIDVIKTNLDGGDRQVVLPGTGKEEDRGTILLASRDWKYLALLSRRDSDLAKLYLIETATDKVSVMDEGDATFLLNGWNDATFVYTVNRNNKKYSDAKIQAIKSYNADTKKLTTLTETTNEVKDGNTYYETYGNVFLIDSTVLYTTNAYTAFTTYTGNIPELKAGIYSVNNDGSQKKSLKLIPAYLNNYYPQFPYISSSLPHPHEAYFSTQLNDKTEKFEWKQGELSSVNNSENTNDNYFTYLASPSNKQTFWYEPRDGKNTLFIGDKEGENGKTVAVLSEYITYGWYSDNYLLVSKGGSELYILPAGENISVANIIKVSDYHKPNFIFSGYGGGYGGL